MYRRLLLIALLGLTLSACAPYYGGGQAYYGSEVYTAPAPAYYYGGGPYYHYRQGYYPPPQRYYPSPRYYQPAPRYYPAGRCWSVPPPALPGTCTSGCPTAAARSASG